MSPDNDDIEDFETPSNDGYSSDDLLDVEASDSDDPTEPVSVTPTRVDYSSDPPLGRSKVLKSGDAPPTDPDPVDSQSLGTADVPEPSAPLVAGAAEPNSPQPPPIPPTGSTPPSAAVTPAAPQPDSSSQASPQASPQASTSSSKPDASSDNPFSKSSKSPAAGPGKPSAMPKIQFVVPNASQNKPFAARLKPKLPADCPPLKSLSELHLSVVGHEDSGIEIKIDAMELVFSGTPQVSGERPLEFRYTIPAIHHDRPEMQQTATVSWFINPDPRSLWKNLDPDASLPYQKPHADHERVAGPATIIAGSVRGRSHAHEGTFRDDDFAIAHDEQSGWYLLTVCDGAGSAKFSRRGSKIACDVIRKEIQTHFGTSLSQSDLEKAAQSYLQDPTPELKDEICRLLYTPMGGTAMKAFKAIQGEAESTEDAVLKDFSTTLIFTIAKQYSWGWFVGSFCIGDGGAGIYSKTDGVKILNTPDGGEFAGQTRFLTMPDNFSSGEAVMGRIQFEVSNEMTALLAMTDGVSDAKFETDNRFFDSEVWHELWRDLGNEIELTKSNPIASEQLMNWLDFWSPGNHDDRTLAILIP